MLRFLTFNLLVFIWLQANLTFSDDKSKKNIENQKWHAIMQHPTLKRRLVVLSNHGQSRTHLNEEINSLKWMKSNPIVYRPYPVDVASPKSGLNLQSESNPPESNLPIFVPPISFPTLHPPKVLENELPLIPPFPEQIMNHPTTGKLATTESKQQGLENIILPPFPFPPESTKSTILNPKTTEKFTTAESVWLTDEPTTFSVPIETTTTQQPDTDTSKEIKSTTQEPETTTDEWPDAQEIDTTIDDVWPDISTAEDTTTTDVPLETTTTQEPDTTTTTDDWPEWTDSATTIEPTPTEEPDTTTKMWPINVPTESETTLEITDTEEESTPKSLIEALLLPYVAGNKKTDELLKKPLFPL